MALPRGFVVLGVVSASVVGTIMWVHHSQQKERKVRADARVVMPHRASSDWRSA